MDDLTTSLVPNFNASVYLFFQRNEVLRISKTGVRFMKKIIALATALAFTAPLAASAASFLTPHAELVQDMQSTYHTSFPNSGK